MDLIFPRLVYRGPAVHLLVTDVAGFDAARADGWFASVPEAAAGRHDDAPPEPHTPEPETPEDDAPPTRAELEQKAHELGVEFSPNIGDKKLAERIAEKLKG